MAWWAKVLAQSSWPGAKLHAHRWKERTNFDKLLSHLYVHAKVRGLLFSKERKTKPQALCLRNVTKYFFTARFLTAYLCGMHLNWHDKSFCWAFDFPPLFLAVVNNIKWGFTFYENLFAFFWLFKFLKGASFAAWRIFIVICMCVMCVCDFPMCVHMHVCECLWLNFFLSCSLLYTEAGSLARAFSIKKSCRAGKMAQRLNTDCFSRGSWFNFQNPRGSS